MAAVPPHQGTRCCRGWESAQTPLAGGSSLAKQPARHRMAAAMGLAATPSLMHGSTRQRRCKLQAAHTNWSEKRAIDVGLGDVVELSSARLGFLQGPLPEDLEQDACCFVLRSDGALLPDVDLREVRLCRQEGAQLPLVSIQLITFDRPLFLRHALQLILQQDAPRNEFEVVVVDDSPQCTLGKGVLDGLDETFLRDCVRFVYLSDRTCIGEKRNLAVASSRGQIIMHWDDDDYFGPTRVRLQSAAILAGKADITLVPSCWTFHSRDAEGPAGFYKNDATAAGGDLCTLSYRRDLWSAEKRSQQYADSSLMEDLFFFRNLTSLFDAKVRVLEEGAVDFLYVKHPRSASAVPRVGKPAAGPPSFLCQSTLELLQRLTDGEALQKPRQTIIDQVQQEVDFLKIYFQDASGTVRVPQKFFMDVARMVPMIPEMKQRGHYLEMLATHLGSGLALLDSTSFTMAAWCCCTLRLPTRNLLWENVARLIKGDVQRFSTRDLSVLAHVLGRVGLRDEDLLKAVFGRVRTSIQAFHPQEVLNLLAAMARLEVDDEEVAARLMLRFPPGEYTSVEWLRLTWAVHRLRPEWAEEGYFPRFINCPPELTRNLFDKLEDLRHRRDVQNFGSSDLPVLLLKSFATAEECQELRRFVEDQGMQRAENSVRRVSVAVLSTPSALQNPLVSKIRARAAELVGLTVGHCEPLHCVRYATGEEHGAHYDFVQDVDVRHAMSLPDPLASDSMLLGGQRHCTVLLYLTSLQGADGGETQFDHLGISVNPDQGAALIWPNVGRDGRPNPLSMHRSKPLVGHEKTVVNAWLRCEDLGC